MRLLAFNPELQRTLWLELSATRLIAMPVVLLLLIGGVGGVGNAADAAGAIEVAVGLLLILWGSRLAADSFAEEVVGRTWDIQRLSAATPWSLALGKLAGGTSYVWYGALLCAAATVFLGQPGPTEILPRLALAGLIAQAAALLAVIVLHQLAPSSRRGHTTYAQAIGLAAALPVWGPILDGRYHTAELVEWYGRSIALDEFVLALELAAAAWFVVGIMRAIRRELGLIDGPLGWALFTLFCLGIAGGFAPDEAEAADILLRPALMAGLLTYGAVLATPVAAPALTRLARAAVAGDARSIWRNLPLWAPSAAAAAGLALVEAARQGRPILLAALGFMVRDIGLCYWLRLRWRQRTALALAVLFGLLYGLLPVLARELGGDWLVGAFMPLPLEGWSVGGPVGLLSWLEAAAVVWLLWRRMRGRG